VFAFHRPETFREWLSDKDTLRAKLRTVPPLITEGLRDCQVTAIGNLEKSLAEARPRALIQIARSSAATAVLSSKIPVFM